MSFRGALNMQGQLGLIKMNIKTTVILMIGFLGLLHGTLSYAADANQLNNIAIKVSAQKKLELQLEFSGLAVLPKSFSVESPPTIVFDFATIKNAISKEVANQLMSANLIKSVNIAETDQKTRVSIDVQHLVPFETTVNGNTLTITFDSGIGDENISSSNKSASIENLYQVKAFDFHRGERGEARIIVDLSTSKAMINFREEPGKVVAEFVGAALQGDLAKKYDVTDFATPVKSIVMSRKGNNVDMTVEATGEYNQIAYQMNNQFVLEVRAITAEEKAEAGLAGPKYSGDKISLNFQNIDLRAVLQIIADFSGFNIITSDAVKGNITLRLLDTPWDQALDIILKSKGLDKRQHGNVLLVAPADQIAAAEKAELQGLKQTEDLGPVKSELIQVNYANATALAALIKDKASSLLTARGTVTVDKRTNILLIQDVEGRLEQIKTLLKKLDKPVRQVEIATQLVSATSELEKSLGIKFGGGANVGFGKRRLGVGAGVERSRAIAENPGGNMPGVGAVIGSEAYNSKSSLKFNDTEGLFSDFGIVSGINSGIQAGFTPGTVGLALSRLPNGTLLDLELAALEYETRSKTLARPKIITQDQSKATISQGIDIPYLSSSSSGAATVTYKSAKLSMAVTPQISPENKISLDLNISNDSVGNILPGAGPEINTNSLVTKILVDNGETVVLGGVLQILDSKTMAKIPFFGDLPLIGGMFRNKHYNYVPKELLVFITPKIIDPVEVHKSE